MRRRPRIDLGQPVNEKEKTKLKRQQERWVARNKDKHPSENPYLAAIKPEHHNYGDPTEDVDDFRKRLENLEFGNFPGYFNYRKNAMPRGVEGISSNETVVVEGMHGSHLDAGLSDERLSLIKSDWFRGKHVLDIGCNRGHITYAIAKMHCPQFILGIDIDQKMINMANRDLHLHIEDSLTSQSDLLRIERATSLKINDNGTTKEYQEEPHHFPLSCYIAEGPIALQAGTKSETIAKFPNNLLFVEHNYVLARDDLVDKQKPYFDTILCLSVTKWIHLNYGDQGLKRFFKRMYKHLNDDGLLILEVQPFDNYARRKKISDRLRANYYNISFKPDQFQEYLLGPEVGFRKVLYSTTTDHKCQGFKRPLTVYLK